MHSLSQSTVQRLSLWLPLCLCVCVLVPGGLVGCGRNPYAPGTLYGAPYGAQYPGAQYPGAQYPGAQYPGAPGVMPGNPAQLSELERRIQQLDMDNRQLTTQLAQSQQRMQVADQRASLFQQQLADATGQLQQARLAQQDLQGQARGLQASINARGGATLRPNVSGQNGALPGLIGSPGVIPSTNGYAMTPGAGPAPGAQSGSQLGAQPGSQLGSLASLGAMPPLSTIQVPGATVQMEGQAVRIRVPADQLFTPGTAQLNPAAYQVLDRVADALHRYFPRQRVAIEAHTDTGSAMQGQQGNPYQLAAAQAQSVLDQLTRRNQLDAGQLTTVASGPNTPRADNQSAAGRAENRRIEFVISL